jgi:hypothetical protein
MSFASPLPTVGRGTRRMRREVIIDLTSYGRLHNGAALAYDNQVYIPTAARNPNPVLLRLCYGCGRRKKLMFTLMRGE